MQLPQVFPRTGALHTFAIRHHASGGKGDSIWLRTLVFSFLETPSIHASRLDPSGHKKSPWNAAAHFMDYGVRKISL